MVQHDDQRRDMDILVCGWDPRPTTERSREGLFERNDALSHRGPRPPLLSIDLRPLFLTISTFTMSASPAYSICLTCSDASSSGSSRASSPSQPLVSPLSSSNIDISLHTISNIFISTLSGCYLCRESVMPTTIRLSLLKRSTKPEISLLL